MELSKLIEVKLQYLLKYECLRNASYYLSVNANSMRIEEFGIQNKQFILARYTCTYDFMTE